MKYIPYSNRYLIKLILTAISMIYFGVIPLLSNYNQNYKKIISSALKNTYKEGLFNYSLIYRSLIPTGDTISIAFSTLIENKDERLNFISSFKDTLKTIYFNDELLYINMNQGSFKSFDVKQRDIEDQIDALYLPSVRKRYLNHILNRNTVVEKLHENSIEIIFRANILNEDDIDSFYFILKIEKSSNSISEYSYSAKIGGVPIWESWQIIYIPYYTKIIDSKIIAEDYTQTKQLFRAVNASKVLNQDSLEFIRTKLFKMLPNLDLISLKGDTIRLTQLDSKYYLVDFWYRSCYPCIKSIPIINKLHSDFNEDILTIVSINSIDKNVQLIHDFIEHNEIKYPVYTHSLQVDQSYNAINAHPYFIIYDSNFNIISDFSGYSEDLYEKIASHLK